MCNIIGLDASLSCTGYVIYNTEENKFTEIGSIPTNAKDSLFTRLDQIYKHVSLLGLTYHLEKCFIEQSFIKFNTASKQIQKATGVAILALGDISLFERPNTTVKKYITGKGNAKKQEMIDSVKLYFPELKIQDDNQADAVAIIAESLNLLNKEVD